MARRKRQRREFGSIDQLPSGRWRARYRLDDGTWRNAPHTFDGVRAAESWLARERGEILGGRDRDPDPGSRVRFGDYAEEWLAVTAATVSSPALARTTGACWTGTYSPTSVT